MKRFFEIFFLICAIVMFCMSCAVFYAAVQFSRGPVNIMFAQKYIQDAFAGGDENVKVQADGIIAEWKSLHAPLSLGIANLRVIDSSQETLNVSQAGIQLAKWPLLFGIVAPASIYIKGPSIKLVRNENGKFSFFVSDKNTIEDPVATKKQFSIADLEKQIFLPPFTRGLKNSRGSHLETIVIEDARIAIEDRRFGDSFLLPEADFNLQRQKDRVISTLAYRSEETGEMSKLTVTLLKQLTEYDYLAKFDNVESDIWIRNLVSFPSMADETYVIDGQVAGSLDKGWMPKTIAGEIAASNPSFDSQIFGVAGKLNDKTGIFALHVSLEEIALDQIAVLWPPELEDLSITHWLTERLSDGIIQNLTVEVPLKFTKDNVALQGEITGDLDFENLTADYNAPLMPITDGIGHARIANDSLEILVKSARLNDVDISDSRVLVTNLTEEPDGVVDIDLNLKGPAKTVIDYISDEPINIGKSLGVDAAQVKGLIDAKVAVDFPAVHDVLAEDFVVKVEATLSEMLLPKIVHGLDLSGGPFALKVEKGMFEIEGQGQLAARNIDLTYSEYINPENAPYHSDIKAKLVSDEDIRNAFGADLSSYVSGLVPLDITYREETRGNAVIEATADLTPAQFFVKPLDYLKKEGAAGQATATIILKDGDVSEINNLNVTLSNNGSNDAARNGQLKFGKLRGETDVTKGSFSQIKLGPTNDFSLDIAQDNDTLTLNAQGATIDAQPFLHTKIEPKKPQDTPRALKVTAKVDKLRTGAAPDQVLKNANLSLALNKNEEVQSLKLTGIVGQKGQFSASISPDGSGRTQMRIISDDAGATFNTLGVYENIVGGTLDIMGAQIQGGAANDIEGQGIINDFRVVRAPVLARLISVFSLTGLPQLLMNDGISFSRLRTKFIWKTKTEGRVINLYDGSTAGGSIGLTFGGTINQTKKTIDVSGTFVPISQINKIIGSIPLVGKLLTGGKNGGIIAATYAVKGPTTDPNVSVNPLSVIAPGFIRSILFEGGMNKGADEAPAK